MAHKQPAKGESQTTLTTVQFFNLLLVIAIWQSNAKCSWILSVSHTFHNFHQKPFVWTVYHKTSYAMINLQLLHHICIPWSHWRLPSCSIRCEVCTCIFAIWKNMQPYVYVYIYMFCSHVRTYMCVFVDFDKNQSRAKDQTLAKIIKLNKSINKSMQQFKKFKHPKTTASNCIV